MSRNFYLDWVRPLLFRLDPEDAHHLTLMMMRLVGVFPPAGWIMRQMFSSTVTDRPVRAFGLTFPNAVGLAAGYDKDGLGWRGLATLGFGHIEIGTVTSLPQLGNARPRVFRLIEDEGVINRMGFPSQGAEIVTRRLRGRHPSNLILGVNIGRNKATPNEEASRDYIHLLKVFSPLADYLAINVSSPNTPLLRMLQNRFALELLLSDIVKEREEIFAQSDKRIPLLVKLSPDIPFSLLGAVLEAVVRSKVEGVIVTNTTVTAERAGLMSSNVNQSGGVSGAPLKDRALSVLRFTARELRGKLPIVSSGGIMTPKDAQWRLDAGATLVQLYTGMIYSGPSLVRQVMDTICRPY